MKLKKILVFVCMIFCFMSVSNAFSDLSEGHWAYDKVVLMTEQGIINGYEDGTFKPDKVVLREEFAKILTLTLNLKSSNSLVTFKDVEDNRWSKEYIDAASPYLTGYLINGEYYFYPDSPAVREDMAVAVVKAKGLDNQEPDYSVLDRFSDKDLISANLKKYIAIAVENKIMQGNGDGTFNPLGNLTRAEITSLMSNVSDKVVIGEQKIIPIDEALVRADLKGCKMEPSANFEFFVVYDRMIKTADVKVKNKAGKTVDLIAGRVGCALEVENSYPPPTEFDSIVIRMKFEAGEEYTVYVSNVTDTKGNRIEDFSYKFYVKENEEIPTFKLDAENERIDLGSKYEDYKVQYITKDGNKTKWYIPTTRYLEKAAKESYLDRTAYWFAEDKTVLIKTQKGIQEIDVTVLHKEKEEEEKLVLSTDKSDGSVLFLDDIIELSANGADLSKGSLDYRVYFENSLIYPGSFRDGDSILVSDIIKMADRMNKDIFGKEIILQLFFDNLKDNKAEGLVTYTYTVGVCDVEDENVLAAIKRVYEEEIMLPYEGGYFRPENTLKRAEMAKIVAKMVGVSDEDADVLSNKTTSFRDVPAGRWYTGWIKALENKNLLIGASNSDKFRPEDEVTMNEVLTFMVDSLGRGEYVSKMGSWPGNYITEAARLGLTNGINGSEANRGNIAIIVCNTLDAPKWEIEDEEILPEKYEVSVIAEGAYIGGAGKYIEGEKVEIILTPKDGYKYLRIQRTSSADIDKIKVSINKNNVILSFNMPARDGEIEVLFTNNKCINGGSHRELIRYTYIDENEHTEELYCGACNELLGNAFGAKHTFTDGKCVCGAEEEEEILYGDANDDGKVDLDDSVYVLRYAKGLESKINKENADVFVDGKVDYMDSVVILKYLSKAITNILHNCGGYEISYVPSAKYEGAHNKVYLCNCKGVKSQETEEHIFDNGKCVCGAEEEEEILYGDVNGDGKVTSGDYARLNAYLLGKINDILEKNADVDLDGELTENDAWLMNMYLLERLDKLPHKCNSHDEYYEEVDKDYHKYILQCECGKISYESSKESHTYVDGKCVCGAEEEEEILYGDVNGDGNVTLGDSTRLNAYLLGKIDDISEKNADVDLDGKLTENDAWLIKQYYSSRLSSLPHDCNSHDEYYEEVDKDYHKYILQCECGKISYESSKESHTYVDGKCVCGAEEEEEILYGDVNGDGKVNAADYMTIARAVLSPDHEAYKILSPEQEVFGDVDKDGKITENDVWLIKMYTGSRLAKLPHECNSHDEYYEEVDSEYHKLIEECECGEIRIEGSKEDHAFVDGECVCGAEEDIGSIPSMTSSVPSNSTINVGSNVKIIVRDEESFITTINYYMNGKTGSIPANNSVYALNFGPFKTPGTYKFTVKAQNGIGNFVEETYVYYVK